MFITETLPISLLTEDFIVEVGAIGIIAAIIVVLPIILSTNITRRQRENNTAIAIIVVIFSLICVLLIQSQSDGTSIINAGWLSILSLVIVIIIIGIVFGVYAVLLWILTPLIRAVARIFNAVDTKDSSLPASKSTRSNKIVFGFFFVIVMYALPLTITALVIPTLAKVKVHNLAATEARFPLDLTEEWKERMKTDPEFLEIFESNVPEYQFMQNGKPIRFESSAALKAASLEMWNRHMNIVFESVWYGRPLSEDKDYINYQEKNIEAYRVYVMEQVNEVERSILAETATNLKPLFPDKNITPELVYISAHPKIADTFPDRDLERFFKDRNECSTKKLLVFFSACIFVNETGKVFLIE